MLRDSHQVSYGSDCNVWVSLFEATNWVRYNSNPSTKCNEGIFWDAREYQLHALIWKNCPIAWQELYKGHTGECIFMLDAVWLWPMDLARFFRHGKNSQRHQVLQLSPLFASLVEGHALRVNFEINGYAYNKGYYLVYGIYREYAIFVKTISDLLRREAYFLTCQEVCRKDVEREFQLYLLLVWKF
jgi:hypothetical protein